eukprot:6062718-Pyramimonas_sp.AAC.1
MPRRYSQSTTYRGGLTSGGRNRCRRSESSPQEWPYTFGTEPPDTSTIYKQTPRKHNMIPLSVTSAKCVQSNATGIPQLMKL